MRNVARWAMAAGLSAVLAIPAQGQEGFEWSGRLAAGQALQVRGISGHVVASLAPGEEARVVATKRGRASDFDEVSIEMTRADDAVVVCAIYGRANHGSGCRSESRERENEDRGRHEIRVSVDFEVQVPADVPFDATTVSGDVRAEGLRSDVDAATVSGNVAVATTGVAHARTVSGDLEVDVGSLDWSRLDFRTVSGDIVVGLPEGVDADVEFASLSGDFDSDFSFARERTRDRWVGSSVRGTIGQGGRRLTLHTVSGDVRLRRSAGGAP